MVSENKNLVFRKYSGFWGKTELGFLSENRLFQFFKNLYLFILKNLNISILWIILFISSKGLSEVIILNLYPSEQF